MSLINFFKEGLPTDKVLPGNKRVVLKPILESHFREPTSLMVPKSVDQKKQGRAAILFEIIAMAPDVEIAAKPELGDFVVIGESALDFASVDGQILVCHQDDVGVIYRKADLEAPGVSLG